MKRFLAGLLALVMTFSFVGCGNRGTDSEEAKEKGKLVVGITEYMPMNYKENGEWTGFDTEFARLFAKEKLGVEVEFVEIKWTERFDKLKNYEIDCIWNGMTINENIPEEISVSYPYALNSQVLVMKADKIKDYNNGYEVRLLKFSVEEGSAGYSCINREKYKNLTLVETQAQALALVNDGTVDATVIDSVMADAMVGEGKTYPDLAKGFSYSSEYFGVAFRNGSDFTKMFNEFMEEICDEELFALAEKYNLILV